MQGKADHRDLDDNFRFYMNQISSKPDGDFIDKIHVDWWGDYRLLEVHQGYMQWLFPIRESSSNRHAQELQFHEIKKLQRSKNAMNRILTSYRMMLDFYGMKLDNEDDGTIVRAENWRDRFRHLDRSSHNYLQITRILKSLGEFGYEHLKKNFVMFILYEGLVKGTLSNLIDSCVKYWIGVLKEDEERAEVFDYYEKLIEDDNSKFKLRRNRSPSPPSFSRYWSNKDIEKKSKSVSSKKDKDGKKDEMCGDGTKVNIENEFSDDEDGTLYYAMNLIYDGMPDKADKSNKKHGKSKTSKDHEKSDSGGEDEYHQDKSQEMKHWNEESKKASAEDIEGGSECYSYSSYRLNKDTETKSNVRRLEGVAVGKVENKKDDTIQETSIVDSNGNQDTTTSMEELVSELESAILLPQQAQNERIILNIGGQCFETSMVTLQKVPGSLLAEIVSEEGMTPRNGNVYFLDRDPAHFRFVLNFLRNGLCDLRTLPHDLGYLYELYYEAAFYRLPGLVNAIMEKIEQLSVVSANLAPLTLHKLGDR